MAAKLCRSAFTVSIRRRSRLRHSSEDRGLVDGVAIQLVELVRKQIRRERWIAGREGRRLAVEVDADELVGRLVLEADRPPQTRAKPAGEQVCLRLGAGDLDLLHGRDLWPEGGEHWPPPARARPGDVRDRDAVEDLSRPRIRRR